MASLHFLCPACGRDTPHADDVEHCIACDVAFAPGDKVYDDVSGGSLHADCAEPSPESFVRNVETGEPLRDGDPIPEPYIWGANHG